MLGPQIAHQTDAHLSKTQNKKNPRYTHEVEQNNNPEGLQKNVYNSLIMQYFCFSIFFNRQTD